MEIVERIGKGKQREKSLDRVEEEGEVEGQEEKDTMESVVEGSVVFLQLHTLSELELDRFILSFL